MRDEKEILILSKIFLKYNNSYNYLNKYPENVNLGLLIKVHGSFNGLLFYKKEIIKIKYNIISNFIKNKFNIYFYCYSKFLGASRIIMGKSWFRIKSILEGLTIEEMEGLASRASRYSLVSRYMKPFSQVLYHAYSGRINRFATIPILEGSNLWEVIRLWQMFFVLMDFDPAQYTRHLTSFAPSPTPS
jgi:hypothetical protein